SFRWRTRFTTVWQPTTWQTCSGARAATAGLSVTASRWPTSIPEKSRYATRVSRTARRWSTPRMNWPLSSRVRRTANSMTSCAAETAPEESLHRLIAAGYRFVHPRDDDGQIMAVVGFRVHDSVGDVVRIAGADEV